MFKEASSANAVELDLINLKKAILKEIREFSIVLGLKPPFSV